jgi:hypothetical protein
MIVLCPSCQTRFRHESAVAAASLHAECSRCDERFPLSGARRTYVLLPGTGRRVERSSIGMDDPTLASRVRDAVADTHVEDVAEPEREIPFTPAAAMTAAATTSMTAREPEPEPERAPEPRAFFDAPAPASAAKAPLGRQAAAALAPAGLAAIVAYALSRAQEGADPLVWAALGAALGLLVGWGCVHWIRRRD